MTAFSDYFEGLIVDFVAGDEPPAAATPYLGLFANSPTDANTGTEITTVLRAGGRVAITFGAKQADGSRTVRKNSAEVNFGNAAASGNVTHVGIFDAQSGGNLLMWGAMAPARQYAAGDPIFFPVGRITIGVD